MSAIVQSNNGPIRWNVRVVYNTEDGDDVMEHKVSEIDEIHDIVEAGPSFYAIRQITITLANPANLVTVEASL